MLVLAFLVKMSFGSRWSVGLVCFEVMKGEAGDSVDVFVL